MFVAALGTGALWTPDGCENVVEAEEERDVFGDGGSEITALVRGQRVEGVVARNVGDHCL